MADADDLIQEADETPMEDDAADDAADEAAVPTDVDADPQIQVETVEEDDDEEEQVDDEPLRELSTPPRGSLPSNVRMRLSRESLSPLLSPLLGAFGLGQTEEEVEFIQDENAVSEPITDDVVLQLVQALARNVRDPNSVQRTIMSQVQGRAANLTSQVQSQLSSLSRLRANTNVTVRNKSFQPKPQQPQNPLPGSIKPKLPKVSSKQSQLPPKSKTNRSSMSSNKTTGSVVSVQSSSTGTVKQIKVKQAMNLNVLKAQSGIRYTKAARASLSFEKRCVLDEKMTSRVLPSKSLLCEVSYSQSDPDILANTSNLTQNLRTLRTALRAYDMLDVCDIVVPIDVYNFPNLEQVRHDLFQDFVHLTPEMVCVSNFWYRCWTDDPFFEQDLDLTSALLKNNCTSEFWNQLEEDASEYEEEYHGGPLMFYFALVRIQNTSEAAINFILKQIQALKISKLDGENVELAVKQLRCNYAFICNASMGGKNYLPSNFSETLLEIFQTTTIPKFNDVFAGMMAECDRSTLFQGQVTSYPTPEAIFRAATAQYRRLIATDHWNLPAAARKNAHFLAKTDDRACFNCEDPGHLLPDCPEPIDEERVKKNREAFRKAHPPRTNPTSSGKSSKNNRTPAPPVRETRVDPSTGEHQVLNKKGEWVRDSAAYHTLAKDVISVFQVMKHSPQFTESDHTPPLSLTSSSNSSTQSTTMTPPTPSSGTAPKESAALNALERNYQDRLHVGLMKFMNYG